jgi:hypothetical protein
METRRQRRIMRRRLRKVGASLAVVAALGVSAIAGTAFGAPQSGCGGGPCGSGGGGGGGASNRSGFNFGGSGNSSHLNNETGHFFATDDHGGRSDRP